MGITGEGLGCEPLLVMHQVESILDADDLILAVGYAGS